MPKPARKRPGGWILRVPLTVEQILRWADEYHLAFGEWPKKDSGRRISTPGENWRKIDDALRHGYRTLNPGSSLAQLLSERRGVPNDKEKPPLSKGQVLAWADEHYKETGTWPDLMTGSVLGAPGETWRGIDSALRNGRRGFPGGDSLPRLLADHPGRRNAAVMPSLSAAQILSWADAFHARRGRWPSRSSGPVKDTAAETWMAIDLVLQSGGRGLPGGSSLAALLIAERGAGTPVKAVSVVTSRQVLAWADMYHRREGKWPTSHSGPVVGSSGHTWQGLDKALRYGRFGLPGGASLAQLLEARRGKRVRRSSRPVATGTPDPPGVTP